MTSSIQRNRKPAFRSLRGYAFDPSLSLKIETVAINEVTYKVPWEDLCDGSTDTSATGASPTASNQAASQGNSPQGPGPTGEYLEVIDYDPTVGKFYAPVNLNEHYPLAMDGLDPSESDPQFHQQMVYAVVMTTIRNFETALGRKVLWAPRRVKKGPDEYVQRLRVYPHALREANAYYSPQKKALLFGYFSARPANIALHMPEALTFTCLSHDVIAHETTHAILDGIFPYYNEPSNPDVLAFHEAFADIVALFQHFTFPEVLKHQIAKTRGDLASQNLLGQLAQEFGSAIGSYGSLRDAIGVIDPETKKWKLKDPDPSDYESTQEPHQRGSILVAAVFEAFLSIYKNQVADLLRIATNGTGVLQEGELHPDLVNRLAEEAAACSQRILGMCIRALDYCPPVDITFGEYLRGIITADLDTMGDERHTYRLAFIDGFRRRGIYPKGIKALSVDSLAYPFVPKLNQGSRDLINKLWSFLDKYKSDVNYEIDRGRLFKKSRDAAAELHAWLWNNFDGPDFQRETGLTFDQGWKDVGVTTSEAVPNAASFYVQNLRVVSRTGTKGRVVNNIVFSLVQRAGVKLDGDNVIPVILERSSRKASKGDGAKENGKETKHDAEADKPMIFRGGCTLVFDLDTVALKYIIQKPLLDVTSAKMQLDGERARAQYHYQRHEAPMAMGELQQYFGMGAGYGLIEPFAMLHQH
jgi:hypothetical protein